MKNMTDGSITKNILFFSIPMLIGNVFQQFYNVVDSIIVGRFIGKAALASVGASFPVIFLIIALIMGVTTGGMVLISQFYGAKDFVNLRKMIDTAYISLFVMSLILTVAGLLSSDLILKILKTPLDIYDDAKIYLRIIFIGMIMLFGYNGLSAVMRGVGDSKTPLLLLIIASILNVILDLIFVIVFKWGISGAAWATVISQGVSFFLGVIILNYKESFIAFNLKEMSFNFALFKKSVSIGVPSGIQQTAVAFGMMALTRIVNNFGTNALAAFTVVGRIDSFAMMPAMNFSMALSTFTGQNIGANQLNRVSKGLKSTLIMSSLVSLLITMFIILFGKYVIMAFNTDETVIKIGLEYLYIVGGFYIAFSLMFVYNGLLRGAGDTFIPMLITITSLWLVRIPISVFLSKMLGTKGIWLGIPVAWIIGAIAAFFYYNTGNWKTKKTIEIFEKV